MRHIPMLAEVTRQMRRGAARLLGLNRRVSCIRGTPGYARYITLVGDGSQIDVYVDGERVQESVTADPDGGVVLANKLNAAGKAYLDDRGEVAREVLYGRVQVFVDGVEV